jgi:hypothetical protein
LKHNRLYFLAQSYLWYVLIRLFQQRKDIHPLIIPRNLSTAIHAKLGRVRITDTAAAHTIHYFLPLPFKALRRFRMTSCLWREYQRADASRARSYLQSLLSQVVRFPFVGRGQYLQVIGH